MICRSTSRFHHLRRRIDPEGLPFGADQCSNGQCWLSGTRSNIQNCVPAANRPIFDKSLRDRRKHLPDDFAVLFPERRGITPYAYTHNSMRIVVGSLTIVHTIVSRGAVKKVDEIRESESACPSAPSDRIY